MNYKYIDYLIEKNRSGKLINLLKSNINNWSLKEIFYVFTRSKYISYNYDVFYFMMETIYKTHNINFFYYYENYSQITEINFIDSLDDGYYEIMKYLLREKKNVYNLHFQLINAKNLEYVNIHKHLIKNHINFNDENYFISICTFTNKKQNIEFYMSPYIRNISKSFEENDIKKGFIKAVFYGNDEIVEFLTSSYMYDIYPQIIDLSMYKQSFIRACNISDDRISKKIRYKKILTHIFSKDVQDRYPELNKSNFSKLARKKIENIISQHICNI